MKFQEVISNSLLLQAQRIRQKATAAVRQLEEEWRTAQILLTPNRRQQRQLRIASRKATRWFWHTCADVQDGFNNMLDHLDEADTKFENS